MADTTISVPKAISGLLNAVVKIGNAFPYATAYGR